MSLDDGGVDRFLGLFERLVVAAERLVDLAEADLTQGETADWDHPDRVPDFMRQPD